MRQRHLQEGHEENEEQEDQEEVLAARRPGLGELSGLRRRDGPAEDQAEEDCLPEA